MTEEFEEVERPLRAPVRESKTQRMQQKSNRLAYVAIGALVGAAITFLCLSSYSTMPSLVDERTVIDENGQEKLLLSLRSQLEECKNKTAHSWDNSNGIPIETEKDSAEKRLTHKQKESRIKELWSGLEVLNKEQAQILKDYGLTADDAKKALWYAKGMQEPLVKRMQAAVARTGSKFIISFTGMSVCAGHGNYINESYPNVVDAMLKKVFSAVGVMFEARNKCMGGTYTFPYAWCIKNIAGVDTDVVAWDFGMMEAGRPHLTDAYISQLLTMPNKPALVFMAGYANNLLDDQSGGAITSVRGYRSDSYRMRSATVFAKEAHLPTHAFWIAPALGSKYTQKKLDDSHRGKGGIDNFIALERKDGSPTPPLLMNLREYRKRGLPGQASWHPAFREHRVIGALFSYNYMDLLKKAVDAEINRLRQKTSAPPPLRSQLIEKIKWSGKDTCDKHPELLCGKSFQCATGYEPREGHGLVDMVENDNYHKALAPADNTAIRDVINFKTGYLDRKYAYKGKRSDGLLSFRLHHASEGGTVVVCEPTYGWRKPEDIADLKSGVEFYIDNKKQTLDEKLNKLMTGVAKNCVLVTSNCPKGGHDIQMKPVQEGKWFYVSFVMWT
ncbi:hypothetical protein AAMO2058_001035100 [Amorphochlora amoebiformis]